MFEGFEERMIDTGEATLRVRQGGSGPPLLLLHGAPQTHVTWNVVAPLLARDFTVVAADLKGPDGLAFSPDERKLYIIEDDAAPQVITVYDVVDDGTRITNRRIVFSFDQGGRGDGLRVDVDGNLWCGWGGGEGHDGVMILNSAGMPIGHIDLPERCANVCFGGFRRSRLFMAASHSLYSVFVRTQGAPGG